MMKILHILLALAAMSIMPQAQAKLHFYKCYVQLLGGDKAVIDVQTRTADLKAAARAAVEKGERRPRMSPVPVTKVYQCVERGKTFANPEARQLDEKKLR